VSRGKPASLGNQPLDKPSVLKVNMPIQTAKEALKENVN
jgi:hypothetical protein